MPACNAEAVKVFSNAEVRAWARDNGYEVADRGRIPVAVVAAYEAAHQEAPVSDDFVSDVSEPDDDPAAADPDPYEADPAEPDQARSDTEGSDSYGSWETRAPWTPTWAPPPPPGGPPAYAPPQWGAPAPGPDWGRQAPPSPGREGFSIASLVLGIIPVFGGILAIVFGIVALRRIRRSRVRVGDCVSSIPDGVVLTVQVVPCREPHRAEVYGEFALGGAEFPGRSEAVRFASGGCTDRLIAFVGRLRAEELEIHYLIPTAETWNDSRTVHCLLAAL